MRTFAEIRDDIRSRFIQNAALQALYGFTGSQPFSVEFSTLSLESILIDVITTVVMTHEQVYNAFTLDVQSRLDTLKPHTLKWYQAKALAYRHGQALEADTDGYSDTGLTIAAIEASKVVKRAAAVEQTDGSGFPILRIKVAGLTAGAVTPLSGTIVTALNAYYQEIKDAGVRLVATSDNPDDYKAYLQIFYDALVLDGNGVLLGGSAEVVRDGVTAYLQNLPFNGEFSKTALQDYLQTLPGVKLVNVITSQSRYGILPFADTGERMTPNAGFMSVASPSDLIINYIAY